MISVTVPICNEAGNLPTLCERIRETLEKVGRPWELILVNDGSTDGSEEMLDELAASEPRFRVVHFRRNFGQTAAMMAGFDFAKGDIIIPMDGDLQNDPADIPKMLAKLDEGFDVCSGWRKDRKDNALKRNLPSIMANRLISFVSGVRLHDFGCSLKAYRREVVEGLRLYGEMHRFLPVYVSWHGARITEVEVSHYARTSGKSKYGLERVLKVLADLIVVKFLDRFQQKPMYLFGAIGLLSWFISASSGGYALWRKFGEHEAFIRNPLLLLSALTGVMGIMCVLMGLLAEMIMRTFYESQGKSVYLVRAMRNLEPKVAVAAATPVQVVQPVVPVPAPQPVPVATPVPTPPPMQAAPVPVVPPQAPLPVQPRAAVPRRRPAARRPVSANRRPVSAPPAVAPPQIIPHPTAPVTVLLPLRDR